MEHEWGITRPTRPLYAVDAAHEEEGEMRTIIGAIAIATLMGTGLTGPPAASEAAGGRVGTAEFTGTAIFFPSTDCAAGPHQDIDATIAGRKDATLHIEGCVDLSNASNIRFTGSFTIAWSQHRSVTGTAISSPATTSPGPCASGLPAALNIELTPVRDHGLPRPPIALRGTWCSPGTPGVPGPISGTLTGFLPPVFHP
jgi:hypothetical protein